MKKLYPKLIYAVFLLICSQMHAQVGISTVTPQGALDVTSTTNGILIPRVALTSKAVSAPVVNPQGGALASGTLIWNTATAGVIPNNVIPGYYYWDAPTLKWVAMGGTNSNNWTLNGNTGVNGGTPLTAGLNYIGTTDNQNLDIHTNNTYVGRFSSLGEFFLGTLSTVLLGDLMNSVGNTTFPWALNGYSSFNGAGTYGQITGGATIFAGVQGEYNGSNAQGAGTRGIYLTGFSGASFAGPASGVSGNATSAGNYKFGVFGNGGTSIRSGGVMGYNYSYNGALGYYASTGLDYDVYGFGQAYQVGTIAGRNVYQNGSLEKNTNIGLGIYGGVMGGWVRGLKYGFHTKGETYSLYVDGSGYTNKPLAYLIDSGNGDKVVGFMSTAARPELTISGKTILQSGKVFVAFTDSFKKVISNVDDIIITASPQGKSNGVYIDQITNEGFWIFENNDGVSNVKISWIAVTKIKGEENPQVPADLLADDFDKKMDGVMYNENNTSDTGQSVWWDGSKIRWDRPENTKIDTQTEKLARPNPKK